MKHAGLFLLALLALSCSAFAQTNVNWGLQTGAEPRALGVYDTSHTFVPVGTVDSGAHIFNALPATPTVFGGVLAQSSYTSATGLGSAANKNIGISSGFVPTLGSLLTSGNCVAINSAGQLVDSGAPCAGTGSGTVSSGTAGQFAYYTGTGTTVGGTSVLTTNNSSTNSFTSSNPYVQQFIGSGTETQVQFTNTSTGGKTYSLISGGSSGLFSGGKFGIFDNAAGLLRFSIDASGAVTIPALTGYVYCNGGSACSASATVPVSSVSGLGAGVATALSVGANAGGGVGLVNSTAPTVGHCLQWGVGGITDAGAGCLNSAFPQSASGTTASGGIPYFSSASVLSSSAVLAANSLVVGGGAGAAPSTVATGAGVVSTLSYATNTNGGLVTGAGGYTSGHCLQWGAGGVVDAGGACTTGGGGGTVTSGVSGQLTYYAANGTVVSGTTTGAGVLTALGNTAGSAGGMALYNDARISGALQASNNLSDVSAVATARGNLIAAKSGANSDITSLTGLTTALAPTEGGTGLTSFSRSGNTTAFATSTGALTNGHCVSIDSNGNFIDAGGTCTTGGGGGTVTNGTSGQLAAYAATGTTVSGITTGTGVLTALGVPLNATGGLVGYSLSGVTGALGYTPANEAGDTFSGNVAVSVSGPTSGGSQPLRVSSSAGDTEIVLSNTSTGGHSYLFATGGTFGAASGGAFSIYDGTVGAPRMAINASGSVGFGNNGSPANAVVESYATGAWGNTETSPTNGLQTSSGHTTGDYTLYGGADRTAGVGYLQSVHYGTSTAPMALNARGGNVGIGTASPAYPLDVAGVIAKHGVNTAPWVNVQTDFGATGNGITDDTAAINNAIAQANSGNQLLYFPNGYYKVCNLNAYTVYGGKVRGDGRGASVLATYCAGGNTFTLNGEMSSIEDLAFTPSVFRTSGFELYVVNGFQNLMRNLNMTYGYNGIAVVSTGSSILENINFRYLTGQHGLLLSGTSSVSTYGTYARMLLSDNPPPVNWSTKYWGSFPASTAVATGDSFNANGWVYIVTTAGTLGGSAPAAPHDMTWYSTSSSNGSAQVRAVMSMGLTWYQEDSYANSFTCISCVAVDGAYGFALTDSASTGSSYPSWAYFFDLEADHVFFAGVTATGGLGLHIDGSWIGSNMTGNGIQTTGAFLGELQVSNTRVMGNAQHGILINAGKQSKINDNFLVMNSAATYGAYNGLTVASGITDFTVTNNTTGIIVPFGSTNQNCGIVVNPGASNTYIITNNAQHGNVSCGIYDGGTGGSKIVNNNM